MLALIAGTPGFKKSITFPTLFRQTRADKGGIGTSLLSWLCASEEERHRMFAAILDENPLLLQLLVSTLGKLSLITQLDPYFYDLYYILLLGGTEYGKNIFERLINLIKPHCSGNTVVYALEKCHPQDCLDFMYTLQKSKPSDWQSIIAGYKDNIYFGRMFMLKTEMESRNRYGALCCENVLNKATDFENLMSLFSSDFINRGYLMEIDVAFLEQYKLGIEGMKDASASRFMYLLKNMLMDVELRPLSILSGILRVYYERLCLRAEPFAQSSLGFFAPDQSTSQSTDSSLTINSARGTH